MVGTVFREALPHGGTRTKKSCPKRLKRSNQRTARGVTGHFRRK